MVGGLVAVVWWLGSFYDKEMLWMWQTKTLACGVLPVNLGAHVLEFAADQRS